MSDPLTDSSVRERAVNRIIAEYFEAVDAGRRPTRRALLAAHPEFAKELSEFLDEQGHIDALAQQLQIDDGGDSQDSCTHKSGLAVEPTPTRPFDRHVAASSMVGPFGDYELLEEVARGGMGIVYRARQVSLNRVVALKMILTSGSTSDEDLARFRIEAEAAAHLDHPNIVPIYEVGEHQGRHYFSMKFIEGGNLAQHLAYFQSKPREIAILIAQVARAVQFAHANGILHRDLKPGNILISGLKSSEPARTSMPWPMITDFGLAKRLDVDSSLTQVGAVVGTPNYMAPEQASGDGQVTAAADIFSLGTILYHMMTGRKPFQADTPLATMLQVQTHDPERPSVVFPQVPRDLETICLKCLEKEPRRRYATAELLADDLDRFARGDPIRARRVGLLERAVRAVRRRPLVSTLSILLIGAMAVALALSQRLKEEKTDRQMAEWQYYADGIRNAQSIVSEKPNQAQFILESLPGPLRGWEWSLLHARSRQSARVIPACALATSICSAFSPTEMLLARITDDARIDLISIPGEARQASLPERGPGWKGVATALRFSPDSALLALTSDRGDCRVWSRDTCKTVLERTIKGASFHDVAFHPLRTHVVFSGRILTVFDLANGSEVVLSRLAAKEVYLRAAWSRDGSVLAACSNSRLGLWSWPDRQKIEIALNPGSLRNLAFLPNGDLVFCDGRKLHIVQAEKRDLQLLAETREPISAVHGLSDGTMQVLCANSQVFRIDRQGTATLMAGGEQGRKRSFSTAQFTEDGQWIAAYNVWEPSHVCWEVFARAAVASMPHDVENFSAAAPLRPQPGVVVGTKQGCLASICPGEESAKLLHEGEASITALAMSADGSWMVAGDTAGRMMSRKGQEDPRSLPLHQGAVLGLAIGDNRVASAGADGHVAVWTGTGEPMIWKAHEGEARATAFSRDGGILISAGTDGVKAWTPSSGKLRETGPRQGAVTCLAVHPTARIAAAADEHNQIVVWDLDQGTLLRRLTARSAVIALAYTNDGRLISGSSDGTVAIWHPHLNTEIIELDGPNEPLLTLFTDEKGKQLFVVYRSGLIRRWDAGSG